MKKIFSIVLCLLMNLSVYALSGTTYGEKYNELLYELDADAGVLSFTILAPSGHAAIRNFADRDDTPIWCIFSDQIKTIILPEGLTGIGDNAFTHMDSVKNIVIPSTVTRIGKSAFNSCTSLDTVVFSESLTTIGATAFLNCKSLTRVKLPPTVASLGKEAFSNCSALDSVFMDETALTALEFRTFSNCSSLKYISLPDGIESIGEKVFDYCSNLSQIIIPKSLKSIRNDAFRQNLSLHTVIWNAKNGPSFAGKSESPFNLFTAVITSFEFGDEVETIPSFLCSGFRKLTQLTIPASVTSIGEQAFYNTTFDTIFVEGKVPPHAAASTFSNSATSAVVMTPCWREQIYAQAQGWNHFTNFASSEDCPPVPTCDEAGTLQFDTIICHSDLPYEWHGHTFTAVSSIVDTIMCENEWCDSLYITYSLDTVYCAPDCPTLVRLDLDTTICDTLLPFTWRGRVFEKVGYYPNYDTIRCVELECDSIITSFLLFTERCDREPQPEVIRMYLDTTVCDTVLFPITWKGHTFDTLGYFADLDTIRYAATNYDSLYVSYLIQSVHCETPCPEVIRMHLDTTVCDTITFPIVWNEHVFDSIGYYDDLDTIRYVETECDSLYVSYLIQFVHCEIPCPEVIRLRLDTTICDTIAFPITWNNHVFQDLGYYDNLDTIRYAETECDSLYISYLIQPVHCELPPCPDVIRTCLDTTICDTIALPIVWRGHVFDKLGYFADLDTIRYAETKCDSLYISYLVQPVHCELPPCPEVMTSYRDTSVCVWDMPYYWNGHLYEEGEFHVDTIRYVATGCDSLITTSHLFVMDCEVAPVCTYPEGDALISGTGIVEVQYILTAIPEPGFKFLYWLDEDNKYVWENPRIVYMDEEQHFYTALFILDSPTEVSQSQLPAYTQSYDIHGRPVGEAHRGIKVSATRKTLQL